MKQTGALPVEIKDEAGKTVACPPHMRAPAPGGRGDDPIRSGGLPPVPEQSAAPGGVRHEDQGSTGDPALGVLLTEPPSGSYVRARYAQHHLAGRIWHRDDTEGHPGLYDRPDSVWWSHDQARWETWLDILQYVEEHPDRLILEQLHPPQQPPGCRPDGIHGSHCGPAGSR